MITDSSEFTPFVSFTASGVITTDTFNDWRKKDNGIVQQLNLFAFNSVSSGIDFNNTTALISIKLGGVLTDNLANFCVTGAKIANLTITEGKLAAGSVTVTKVGTGAITSDKLGAESVTLGKIAINAVVTANIANGSITEEKLAANCITTAKVVNEAITGPKIKIADIIDAVYPIGIVIYTSSVTNPGTVWPSTTWTQVAKGRFIVGVGTDADQNGVSKSFAAGNNPGEYVHTLTIPEMPAHAHTTDEIAGYDDDEGGGNQYKANSSFNWGGTTGSTGGGLPHNNVLPSHGLYVWKRTA